MDDEDKEEKPATEQEVKKEDEELVKMKVTSSKAERSSALGRDLRRQSPKNVT